MNMLNNHDNNDGPKGTYCFKYKQPHHLQTITSSPPYQLYVTVFKNGRVLKLFIIGMHGTVMYFVDEKILSFIAETAGDAT
jgi:hypothetical protein